MKVVIPGSAADRWERSLPCAFFADGHEVVVLSRKPEQAPWRVVEWNAATPGNWVSELE